MRPDVSRSQVSLRMLYLSVGRREDALATNRWPQPAEQEYWNKQLGERGRIA